MWARDCIKGARVWVWTHTCGYAVPSVCVCKQVCRAAMCDALLSFSLSTAVYWTASSVRETLWSARIILYLSLNKLVILYININSLFFIYHTSTVINNFHTFNIGLVENRTFFSFVLNCITLTASMLPKLGRVIMQDNEQFECLIMKIRSLWA